MINMKVLVTGGSGFIGSHLIPQLVLKNIEVWSLERYVTGRYGEHKKHYTVFGDIRDNFSIKKIVKDIQPDALIHLASISPVSYSYEHPQEVIETNLVGTINLAEACLREVPNFKHFLFAGSSEEYGIQKSFPIPEGAELRPNSPYSVSKVASDKYLHYMKKAYDFPITVLRAFNTYGRKEDAHFIVERTITQMLRSKEIRLGDATPIRDFLYVNDHVDAYLSCLDNPSAKGEVFNFCTGKGASIQELVDLIAEAIEFEGDIVWNTIPKRPLDIQKLVGDGTKAYRELGWKAKYSLEEGLRLTIDYWKTKLGGI